MKLNNQTIAVVSGGGSGMGAACAKMLATHQAKVVILDRNLEAAIAVAKEVDGLAIDCDVASAEQVELAFERIKELAGELRVAVNCAGIAPAKRAVGRDGPMALAEFEKVIQVNLIGTFNVSRMAAASMASNTLNDEERGVIINTASIAAYEGQIGQSAYSASKGGVVGMTLPLARELASLAIRVNTIAPGLVGTPLLLNMPQEVQDSLASTVPFPKRFGKVEEFASLAEHVISNTMLNGETIRLDGALRMQPK